MKKLLLTFSLFLIHAHLFATNFYWVGGNGNWSDFQHHWATSSGGTIFQTTIPTAFDDVYFDVNSFPTNDDSIVNIDVSVAYTKKLDFTTNQKLVKLNFTNGALLQVYGSATFADGVKLLNGLLYFKASTPGCQLTFKKSSDWVLSNIYFDGIGGSWQVMDSMVVATELFFLNGELDVTGKTVRAQSFNSDNTNNRNWLFSNSNLYFSWVTLNTTNLAYNSIGSTFNSVSIHADGALFNLDHFIFAPYFSYGMITNIGFSVFTGKKALIMFEDCTFNKLYADSMTFQFKNCTMNQGYWNYVYDVTINFFFEVGELTATGNDCVHQLHIHSGYADGILQKTTGSLVLNYASIKNIKATGGASFTTTNSVDEGGNTGISFNSYLIKTYYWIANSGNGNDPSHWSLSSGGPVNGCIPTPYDSVIFDQNSFDQTTTLHYVDGLLCGTMIATAIDDSIYISSSQLYGSVYLSPLVTFQTISFLANTSGNKIKFNRAQQNPGYSSVYFYGAGSWTLEDSLYAQLIDQTYGYLNSNGKKIITPSFKNYYYGHGDFSHSTIETNSVYYSNTATFETSTFIFPSGGEFDVNSNVVGAVVNYKASLTIRTYTIKKITSYADLEITSLFNTDSLNILQGSTLIFNSISPQTITIIPTSASCTNLTVFRSPDPVYTAYLYKSTGTLQLNLVALVSVHATGGATFIANQSTDLGNNEGWVFSTIASKTYYWINDGGDWDDPQHWSLSSGGAPEGCIPSIQDKVIFDAASFSSSYQIVSKQNGVVQLSGLNAEHIPPHTVLAVNQFNLYGDLKLSSTLNGSTSAFNLMGKQAIHLTSNGMSLGPINTSADTLILMDNLQTSFLNVYRGYINASHKTIYAYDLQAASIIDTAIIDFTGSDITSTRAFFYLERLHVIADNSYFHLQTSNRGEYPLYVGYTYPVAKKLHLARVDIISTGNMPINEDYAIRIKNTIIDDLKFAPFSYLVKFYMENSEIKKMTSYADLDLQMTYSKLGMAQLYANCKSTYGTFHVDYLKIAPGSHLEIHSGDSLYIHEYLDAIGNSSFPINIEASSNGSTAYLYSAGRDFCFAYLNISNISASGANFYAGPSSNDVYNNSGWDFTNTCDVITIDADLPVCKQGAITLTPTHPSNVTGFLWTMPDGEQSNDEVLTIDPLEDNKTGFYTLSIGGQTRKILVEYEAEPDASISLSNTNDLNPSIHFNTDYSTTMGYHIEWYKDGSVMNGITTSNISPVEIGNYYALLTTPNGCSYQTNTISFNNDFSLFAPYHLSAQLTNNHQAILNWQDVNTSENGFEVYFSTEPDQGYILLGTTSSSTYTHATTLSPGTYYYKIRAYKSPSFFSPYSNVASVTVTVTANQHALDDKDYLIIYPVPAEDELHVISSQGNIEQVVIYDQQGAIHFNQSFINDESVLLNIHSLQHGYYLIKVITHKATLNQKFMK